MYQRQIGTTDLRVNEVGYGAMHLSIDREKRPTEADAITLLQRAVDELGVDFIDTADAYCADNTETGHNEQLIASALQGGRREKVVVATKGGSVRPDGRWERDGRPEHLRAACEASLKALGTDRIDLYQYHVPDPNVPVRESVGALADLQKEGKIRYIGVSNFSLGLLQEAMQEATITSLQNQYSALNRRNEDLTIDFCAANGITYIPWNPVGGRGKAPVIGDEYEALGAIAAAHGVAPHTVALAWLLQRSPAILPIPGTRTFNHVADNMKASELVLTADEVEQLNLIDAPQLA